MVAAVVSARLIIFGLIALAFASLAATTFYYRGNAISAQAEAAQARANLAVAEDANKAQQETIGRLRASEAANAKNVADLIDELAAISAKMDEANDAIQALEKKNADVAAYLGAAVPDALRQLLNR